MNFFKPLCSDAFLPKTLLLVAGMFLPIRAAQIGGLEVNGSGWMQYGYIGHSTDTALGSEFGEKSLYASGAQFTLGAKPFQKLEIKAGLGMLGNHYVNRSVNSSGGYAPFQFVPFITEGNFKYSFWGEEASSLYVRGGLFAFNYNPDTKNLGQYLMRGPVYPGLLVSGFETKNGTPSENIAALQMHHQMGSFRQDAFLISETETYPYFDISAVYVASLHIGGVFQMGAGVNFFHLIPADDSVTNGKKFAYVDTVPSPRDTTFLTFPGTKLMAYASFDPKALLEIVGPFGPEDLKLYGEVALFGLNNDAAHKAVYGDYLHRMPMMVGFNLPAFNVLDYLSLEVEWYGAPFPDDFATFNHTRANIPSPFPTDYTSQNRDLNVKEDNWKWALGGAKMIQNRIRISGQVANDHFRPGVFSGYGDNYPPGSESLLKSSKDWAGTVKVAVFF